MTRTSLTAAQMAAMSPWDIARHYGVGYSGDMDPIRHGGLFYSYANWVRYGYADCVEFWEDPAYGDDGGDRVVISRGVINRPQDMAAAFRCCGIESPDDQNNVLCQIECARAYAGAEWGDGSDSFDIDDEESAWDFARESIQALEVDDD